MPESEIEKVESKVVYQIGERIRSIRGVIIERNEWGVVLERDDGKIEITWKDIHCIERWRGYERDRDDSNSQDHYRGYNKSNRRWEKSQADWDYSSNVYGDNDRAD